MGILSIYIWNIIMLLKKIIMIIFIFIVKTYILKELIGYDYAFMLIFFNNIKFLYFIASIIYLKFLV